MALIAKYIIDTNVLFSALYLPDSIAGKLIDLAIEKQIDLFAPEEVKEELTRNLKSKLNYTDAEINFTLQTLPVTWLSKKLYNKFYDKAKQMISLKDAPILAAALFTKLPIITGDKEFAVIKGAQTQSLRDVINSFTPEA